jgi:hypothetical protein
MMHDEKYAPTGRSPRHNDVRRRGRGPSRTALSPTPLSSLLYCDLLLPHTALRGGDAPRPPRHAASPADRSQGHSPREPIGRGHAGAMSLWGEVTP